MRTLITLSLLEELPTPKIAMANSGKLDYRKLKLQKIVGT